MNSQIADEVFMSPVAARSTAAGIPINLGVFKIKVAVAINRAVQLGFFSTTVPLTGAEASSDVQYVVRILNTAGYSAQVTGGNLAVAW